VHVGARFGDDGLDQVDGVPLAAGVAVLVGEAADDVRDELLVTGLPGGGGAEPVRLLGLREPPAVAGGPPGDLRQLTDLGQQRAADVVDVHGLPEQRHGGLELAERRSDEVAGGEHVVGVT
jgi:hypothetical protein